jgi:hypothetical protein
MINWIVAIVSLSALVYVLLWLLAPGFRARVEQPKFDMLGAGRPLNPRSDKASL